MNKTDFLAAPIKQTMPVSKPVGRGSHDVPNLSISLI